MCLCKQRPLSNQFAQATECDQYQRESDAHGQAVQQGAVNRLFRGEGFGTADDDAVGYDEGYKYAEDFVQIMEPGIHAQLDDRHDGGDDQYKHRYPDFRANQISNQ